LLARISRKSGNFGGKSGNVASRRNAILRLKTAAVEALRHLLRGTAMPTPIKNVSAFCATSFEDRGRLAVRRWSSLDNLSSRWVNEGGSVTRDID